MLLRAVRTRPKRPWELSRWLQHGLQSSQDGSKTAQGASKTPLRRLQGRPRSPQDASRTTPRAPQMPPRVSEGLQDGSRSLQGAPRSSPGEAFGPSRKLPRALQRSLLNLQRCPAASSLWPASGLGGKREALTITFHASASMGTNARTQRE